MGLDMYLDKRTFIGNEYRKPEEQVRIVVPVKQEEGWKQVIDAGLKIKTERITSITERVAYWRKANAIHAWFVREVQKGDDDCEEYRVEGEKLRELLATVCRVIDASALVDGEVCHGFSFAGGVKTPILAPGRVIADPRTAAELLPTQPGFFFGGTDYDEGYFADLTYTKQVLEEILLEDPEGEYYYHASW